MTTTQARAFSTAAAWLGPMLACWFIPDPDMGYTFILSFLATAVIWDYA